MIVIAAAAVAGSVSAGATAVKPAYCSLPAGPSNPAWAFHAGEAITSASGSYAHGHGTLSGDRAAGAICQVDRTPGSPDRQIILAVTGGTVVPQHGVAIGAALANRMTLPVRVSSSTDRHCAVGTRGTVTLVATYNGVHNDSVQFAFPRACRDHDHRYAGPQVVAEVPR
jgi:hypothetical protein